MACPVANEEVVVVESGVVCACVGGGFLGHCSQAERKLVLLVLLSIIYCWLQ